MKRSEIAKPLMEAYTKNLLFKASNFYTRSFFAMTIISFLSNNVHFAKNQISRRPKLFHGKIAERFHVTYPNLHLKIRGLTLYAF